MRRKDRAVTVPAAIATIVRESSHVVVSCIDNGRPYAVPMNFGYIGECVYLHSAKAGKKLRILEEAGGQLPVFLTFVSKADFHDPNKGAGELTTHYASVAMEGIMEEVTDAKEVTAGVKAILDQVNRGHLSVTPAELGRIALLRITVTHAIGKSNIPAE